MAMGFLIFAWQVVILDLMCIKSQISCEKHKKVKSRPCRLALAAVLRKVMLATAKLSNKPNNFPAVKAGTVLLKL